MQYVVPYHVTLDELKNACALPETGLLYTTQIRNKLNGVYMHALKSVAEKMFDKDITDQIIKQFTCSTCARFMKRMGGVVAFDTLGKMYSVYWNPEVVTDPFMKAVVGVMKDMVEQSRVINFFHPTGVYSHYRENTNLGGAEYRHFYFPATELFEGTGRMDALNKLDIDSSADRIPALIRLATETTAATMAKVSAWFEGGELYHKGNSRAVIDAFKQLTLLIARTKQQSEYTALDNDYARETLIINTVWSFMGQFPFMLTTSGSALGALLKRANSGEEDDFAKNEWKKNISSLNHRRPTTDASANQIKAAVNQLEEQGLLPSLEQRALLQSELPILYTMPKLYTGPAVPEPVKASSSFGDFAKKAVGTKAEELGTGTYEQTVDLGVFINSILPMVESMALDISMHRWTPVWYNVMADLDAKPVFKWDKAEKRVPYTPFTFNEPLTNAQLKPAGSKDQGIYPVYAITDYVEIGINSSLDRGIYSFVLSDIKIPHRRPPALFPDSLVEGFYNHRRALEEFMRKTDLAEPTEQVAATAAFTPAKIGQQISPSTLALRVTFNETGRLTYNALNGVFKFSGEYLTPINRDVLAGLAPRVDDAPDVGMEGEPAEAMANVGIASPV